MQLAFVAWQTERFGLAAYKAATMPLTPTREFMAWWDQHVDSLASFRDACWRAWLASRGGSERYDDATNFGAWWQTILDAQPVVK